MYHFFVTPEQIGEDEIRITGPDVNHIGNVLRMRPGEKICVSDGQNADYYCIIDQITSEQVTARIESRTEESRELPARIWLFQGLPKGDKMELIIQKAVELGVYAVVPVAMKRSVVKLDEKKAAAKKKTLGINQRKCGQTVGKTDGASDRRRDGFYGCVKAGGGYGAETAAL